MRERGLRVGVADALAGRGGVRADDRQVAVGDDALQQQPVARGGDLAVARDEHGHRRVLEHVDAQGVREVALDLEVATEANGATAERSASSRTCSVVMSRAAASSAARTRGSSLEVEPVTSTSRTAASDESRSHIQARSPARRASDEREQRAERDAGEPRRAQACARVAAPGQSRNREPPAATFDPPPRVLPPPTSRLRSA